MNNTINFKGAFIIKNAKPEIKNEILSTIGSKKQVFENYSPRKILFVVRDSKDKSISDIIQRNKLDSFEYYPNLNNKSGFDTQKVDEARIIIKNNKENKITTRIGLTRWFNKKNAENIRRDEINRILDNVGIQKAEVKYKKNKNGVEIIRSKENNGKILAYISPKTPAGTRFVYVRPKNADSNPIRYSINGNQIFEYKTLEGMKIFRKNFNETLIKK